MFAVGGLYRQATGADSEGSLSVE
jgi:hypothetical protein